MKLLMSLFLLLMIDGLVSCDSSTESTSIQATSSKTGTTIVETEKDSLDLLSWIKDLKTESQSFRDANSPLEALIPLDKCINEIQKKPSTLDEKKQWGWIFVNRAYIYEQMLGDYIRAKEDYLEAMNIFHNCGYEDFYVARFVFQPLGNIYTRLGENEQALKMLERFKEISVQNGALEAELQATNDIARVHMNMSNYATAIKIYTNEINSHSLDLFNDGLIHVGLSESYLENDQYELGLAAIQHSIQQFKRFKTTIDSSDYRFQASESYLTEGFKFQGALFSKLNQAKKAKESFNNALDQAKDCFSDKHRSFGKIHIAFGRQLMDSKDFENAVNEFQLALTSTISNFDTTNYFQNPDISDLYADVTIGEALKFKAYNLFKLYESTKDLKTLKTSYDTYQCYFDWEKKMRLEHQNEYSKLRFASEIHQISEFALLTLHELDKIEPKNDWNERAFEVIDRSKNIVLAENRRLNLAHSQQFLNDSLFMKLQAINVEISIKESVIETTYENSTESIKRSKSKLQQLEKESQLLLFSLKKKYPSYQNGINSTKNAFDIKKLKQEAHERESAILNYFVGNDFVFLAMIDNGSVSFKLLNDSIYRTHIKQFRNNVTSTNDVPAENYEATAQVLYDVLINPVSSELKSVNWIIIPDHQLNYIPFEALVSKKNTKKGFKNLHYLVNDYTISYAPTANFILTKTPKDQLLKTFIGIAPIFKSSDQYAWLSQSEEEIRAGKNVFGGKLLLNKNATKQNFLNAIRNHQIVHLSSHAGTDLENRNSSWIAFHSDSSSARLNTPELYAMNLSNSLVILNACESGNGQFFEGEGTLSMTRGFLSAGTNNVMTNLWSVNHETSVKIIQEFYENASEKLPMNKALKKAKKDYLHHESTDDIGAHPYYWSGTILTGTDSSLSLASPSYSKYIWWGIGILLCALLLFFFKKRKHSNQYA